MDVLVARVGSLPRPEPNGVVTNAKTLSGRLGGEGFGRTTNDSAALCTLSRHAKLSLASPAGNGHETKSHVALCYTQLGA